MRTGRTRHEPESSDVCQLQHGHILRFMKRENLGAIIAQLICLDLLTAFITMRDHSCNRSVSEPVTAGAYPEGGAYGTRNGARTRGHLRPRPGADGGVLSGRHGDADHQTELARRRRLPEC